MNYFIKMFSSFGENEFFDEFFSFFGKARELDIGVSDILDICLVAFIIYNLIKIFRDSRAFRLIKGLVILALGYFIVYNSDMMTSSYIFRLVFQNAFIFLVIIFQDEIRRAVEHLGNREFGLLKALRYGDVRDEQVSEAIIEISKAVQRMADSKTGALIVMERKSNLGEIVKTGNIVDAHITHELMENIFFPNSPLHDGAAIVRDGRLLAAGCVLPLTSSDNVSSDLGTRHRAAIGMSENSDAVIIVVSEETGVISVARDGNLTRHYNESDLRAEFFEIFVSDEKGPEEKDSLFRRIVKGIRKNEKE